MGYRVGVDIGGSFTDFAVLDEATQTISSLKVFSRPDQPGAEVMAGVRLLSEKYGIAPGEITYFTHGTTVGVNTVIQRKGLKLALFVTRDFRDVLELARLKIPDMYSLVSKRPAPLIPRDRVFEISERIRANGSVEEALDEASVRLAVAAAEAAGAEGIVVSLLHAYKNPVHELKIKEIVAGLAPAIPVFCSSETWPIIREYERTITAVIGGYVQPRVAHYLGSLQAALKEAGVKPEPRLTKSNGGVMTAEQGKQQCVQMILSGTASGVIGASYVAQTCGLERCMSLDIGGTSADVALIMNGQPQYGVGERIGDFQIHIPSVSVSSIGEGGGSIAWVDPLGVLRVGPESAGSRPGPACFGRGGTRATITDAFVACGLIGHADLGYDAIKIDRAAARRAISELAEKVNRTVEETAEAIMRIAVSGMYSEVSGLASRYGIDPREFSLLAFGGAGPMLGCLLAKELGMREVVVPLTPGVLSALGGLIADLKNDFIRTVYLDLVPQSLPAMKSGYDSLKASAIEWLRRDQGHDGPYTISCSADMRYRGQSFEIDTPLSLEMFEAGDTAAVASAFHAEHNRIYGHADHEAPIQVIAIRLVISGKTAKPVFTRHKAEPGLARPIAKVDGWIDGAHRSIDVFRRSGLRSGQTFTGPAIVAQDDCTTIVPTGYCATVDEYANIRIVPVGGK